MSRGMRKDTLERILAARERLPLAVGPWLGELCTHFNISGGMVATIIQCHEQTVFRWFFGQSEVTVQWFKPIMKLMALLSWMYSIDADPLTGTVAERLKQLDQRAREFASLTKRTA